jgi:hypothetical protein
MTRRGIGWRLVERQFRMAINKIKKMLNLAMTDHISEELEMSV